MSEDAEETRWFIDADDDRRSSSSRASFPHVETVLEQLVQDPIRDFFGSTLGPTIFGPLIHCCLCRSLLVLIPNSGPKPELVLDPDPCLALASTSSI